MRASRKLFSIIYKTLSLLARSGEFIYTRAKTYKSRLIPNVISSHGNRLNQHQWWTVEKWKNEDDWKSKSNNETSSKGSRFPCILNNSRVPARAHRWFYIQIFQAICEPWKNILRDSQLERNSSNFQLFVDCSMLKTYFPSHGKRPGQFVSLLVCLPFSASCSKSSHVAFTTLFSSSLKGRHFYSVSHCLASKKIVKCISRVATQPIITI